MPPKNALFLSENHEWTGLWWLPEDPDNRVPGTLTYTEADGLRLSLIGRFEDRVLTELRPGVTAVSGQSRTWDAIHGVAQHREITLLDCFPTHSSLTLGARVASPDVQNVLANTAVVGAHITAHSDEVFSAVEISIEGLNTWADEFPFAGVYGTENGRLNGEGAMSVEPVQNHVVTVDDVEYSLIHTHTPPHFEYFAEQDLVQMRHSVCLRVAPRYPLSLDTAFFYASWAQDLLSIASNRAAGVLWLRLETGTARLGDDPNAPVLRRRAEVLYSPRSVGHAGAKAQAARDFLFRCDSIPFEDIVPRWVETHDKLHAATNMVLGLRYAPAQFVENNLTTAAGAAEVLHRRLEIGTKPIRESEFNEIREAMLEAAPEQYRSRFRSAIRNDPTLRDRLLDLAKLPDTEAIGKLAPDIDHWASRTSRARNDIAHEGVTSRNSIEELQGIVDVTTAIVTLCILQHLGLSGEEQRTVVEENPQLRAAAKSGGSWFTTSDDECPS